MSTATPRSGRGRPTGCPSGTCSSPPDWQSVPPNPGTYESYQPGFAPQVTAGATWTCNYDDRTPSPVGVEYFYNSLGYADPAIYPWLIVNAVQPVLRGAALGAGSTLLLPRPFELVRHHLHPLHPGNLSDRSFICRVDYSVLLLTYLRVEAYAAVHYGAQGGAFRFTIDVPAFPPYLAEPVNIPPPIADFGVALRVSL